MTSYRLIDMKDLPGLRLDEGPYQLPGVEFVHKNIVQVALEQSLDYAIITPTLRTEFLDYQALAALFQRMGELTPVFILSPNTAIRDRYEQVENGLHYSREKWPLSTVKADGSLASRTTHVRSMEAPPGVIFSRYSTRLPNDPISEDIRMVLYDDSIKFEEERWERFLEWRERNDIPSVGFFIRDPLGPVYQRIQDQIDAVWAWFPDAIESITTSETNVLSGGQREPDEVVPQETHRERELLSVKTSGQSYHLQLSQENPVVERFTQVWKQYKKLSDAAEDIDEPQVYAGVRDANRAISGFSRLLTSLDYSDTYRAKHGSAVPLSGRINRVKRTYETLQGDAAAGTTPIENMHAALTDLSETIDEGEPGWWKRGAVLKAVQKVVDEENSLIVIVPDEPAAKALRSDFTIEREHFYSKAKEFVDIETPASITQAEPVDYVLLYGPPKYNQRWLLRVPTAPYVGILAYPHELGLLYSQVSDLNRVLRDATDRNLNGESAIPLIEHSKDDLLQGLRSLEQDIQSPTEAGGYDGVSIEIPTQDELESRETESSDGLDEYQIVDTGGESVTEIVSGAVEDYDNHAEKASTVTFENVGESDEHPRSQDHPEVDGCVVIRTRDRKAIAARPSDTIEVVKPDARTTVEKPASNIQVAEQVVAVHDRDAIRDAVEELLLDSGYVDIVANARLWKHQLSTEIEKHEDSLDDFITRLEGEGLDKTRATYRAWYHGDVRLPKAKHSLKAIANAYEMDDVLEHFDEVWDANYTIRTVKNNLIELLKKRAQEILTEEEGGDVVLDEELDIRLSDFSTSDESGNPFVDVHTVAEVEADRTVSRSSIGRWRSV